MRAIISVTGKDRVGIIASISAKCGEFNANIVDITQKVLGDVFVMIMIIDTEGLNVRFTDFVDEMNKLGKEESLVINTMHEDIFNSMHRI